jgi:PTH1 family peptidyl-tRNA hydrolase
MKIVVGLGNPGREYENTRHNAGRIIVGLVEKKVNDTKIKFIKPDLFMNNSGKAVAPFIKTAKDLTNLIVVYDDIDLPIGKIKISFNRSSGGHNGLGSIIKTLKTQEFLRIRIGICPATPMGKLKKPKGEKAILNFLLGDFNKAELYEIKKIADKVAEAIEMFYAEGMEKTMTNYN